MQLTAKFVFLVAAVVYGSISVTALPTPGRFSTREVAASIGQRDLSHFDVREFEEFSAREVVTTPPSSSPVPAVGSTSQTTPTGSGGVPRPARLTHEELAAHRAALADPTHPHHQQALDRKKAVHAYHQAALADPTHPHHANAKAFEEKKAAYLKLHHEALNDPNHYLHKHAKAREAFKAHKAALADPTHPQHAAALAKEEKRKAFKKLHQEALSDPNHRLHQTALAHEAKKAHLAALGNPNHPNHQAAVKEHQDRTAQQQGHNGVGGSVGAQPHAHAHPASSGPVGVPPLGTVHRRGFY